METVLAVTTQVNVDHEVVFEAIEQMFANRLALLEVLAGDLPRVPTKAALRTGDLQ
jgi:hypothetical protein